MGWWVEKGSHIALAGLEFTAPTPLECWGSNPREASTWQPDLHPNPIFLKKIYLCIIYIYDALSACIPHQKGTLLPTIDVAAGN